MSGASGLRKHGHTSAGDGGTITVPGGDAVDVTYDNSGSGLVATDVQGAIDELDTTVDELGGAGVDIDDDAALIQGVNFEDQGGDPAAPAAGHTIIYAKGGGIYAEDDASVVTGPFGTGGGAVGTDVIWDAAGDLAVGSGANTAAKLTKGSAGGALSIINATVAWNSGTSNPGSAVTGDRFWRTDLGREVYYNGSIWLSVQVFRDSFGVGNVLSPDTIASAIGRLTPWATAFDLWLVAWSLSTYPATTNNGTNFWVITLTKNDASDATTNIDSFDTSGDTVNNWTQRRRAIGASYTASGHRLFAVNTALTLAPGGLYFTNIALEYQLIIP